MRWVVVFCFAGECPFRGDDSVVLVFDGVTGRKIARIELPDYPAGFCYHPQANKLYVAGTEVVVIDAAACRVIRRISPGYHTDDICYNRVNNRIYAVGGNLVSVIDAVTDRLIRRVGLPDESWNIVCAPRVNKVYCVMANQDVAVIDGVTDELVRQVPTPGWEPSGLAYNPRQNLIYCAESNSNSISFFDAPTSLFTGKLLITRFPPSVVAYLPGYDRIYCTNPRSESILPIECATGMIRPPIASPVGARWIIPVPC